MKIVILDRDGVINYDSKQFIKSPAEWRPIPGSIEAIAKLNQAGYRVVVATGTTGVPKAAVLSHRAIAANASQVRMLMPTLALGAERFLGVLPLCHVFAMTAVMNIAMTTGSQIILLPRFEVDQLLTTIDRLRPTIDQLAAHYGNDLKVVWKHFIVHYDRAQVSALAACAAARQGKTVHEVLAQRIATVPARRLGTPAEFGALCAFVCSAQAAYLTGQNILLDGGAYPGTF